MKALIVKSWEYMGRLVPIKTGIILFGNTFTQFGNTIYKTPNAIILQWNCFATTHIKQCKAVQIGSKRTQSLH
jgi:hypothetical protein